MPIYKPIKPYTENLNDLIEMDLFKGKAFPVGTTRNWSGTTFVKEVDGWKPVAHAKDEKTVEEIKNSQGPAEVDEKSALKEYQSGMHGSALGGYANLQQYLRSGKPQYGTFDDNEKKLAEHIVSKVSSAIKKHPVEKPTTVFRGLKIKKDDPGSQIYANAKVGDVIQDKGFTSTTTDKKVSSKFSDKLNRSDVPVSLEISLKPGDHALPMDQYHKSTEKEILLDRNTKFKVVSVKESSGVKKIKLEIVQS